MNFFHENFTRDERVSQSTNQRHVGDIVTEPEIPFLTVIGCNVDILARAW
jgi:hypothetical protein